MGHLRKISTVLTFSVFIARRRGSTGSASLSLSGLPGQAGGHPPSDGVIVGLLLLFFPRLFCL
jgi:hypothetical protein